MKPLTMSEEREQELREQAGRAVMVGADQAREAWAEVDALRTKLAETEALLDANRLAAGEAVAEYAELQVALAASQAEVRELRERGAAAFILGGHFLRGRFAELLDAPTSDAALRGLMRKGMKHVAHYIDDSLRLNGGAVLDYDTLLNEVLGPGAAPIAAEIKEGRMDTISEGTPLTPAELVQRAVESKDPVMEDIFTYHAPSGDQQERYLLLRAAAKQFAYTIHALCAPGPDRTHAIRQVREATMTANQSIATNNAIYR